MVNRTNSCFIALSREATAGQLIVLLVLLAFTPDCAFSAARNFTVGPAGPPTYDYSTILAAVNACDPASDYSNEPQFNGGRINLGAYGNTEEASRIPAPGAVFRSW